MLVEAETSRAWRQRFRTAVTSDHFVLYVTLTYCLVLLPVIPRLTSFNNLANILSNVWPLLVVAIGQTIVLLIAGIDLSQTSVMAVAAVIGAAVMTTEVNPLLFENTPLWEILIGAEGGIAAGSSWSAAVGVAAMLAVGVAIGFFNGIAVARFRIPPFMVTLATMMFFSAFALYLTKSENIAALPEGFIAIGRGGIGPVAWAFVIAAALAGCAHVLLRHTVLGRWIYALGLGKDTARVSGVPTRRVIVFAYVFSGFCAALAAVLYSARLEAGRPTLGANLLLDIIGAVVIGGTSLFGGKGKVLWTIYGVLFFVVLSNTLNLLNLSYFTINMVKGGIILLAAYLDVLRSRLRG